MKTRYVKHNRADSNTTVWAATAESAVRALHIAAELEKQGFAVTTEKKTTPEGAFLWYNVQGTRQWKTDEELREARQKQFRAPCGTGVRL